MDIKDDDDPCLEAMLADSKQLDINLPPPPIQTTARGGSTAGRKPKGRLKKTKNKRGLKITGPKLSAIDFLHSQTLLSTSPQGVYLPIVHFGYTYVIV